MMVTAMERASSLKAFNILFAAAFFASFVYTILHFSCA
jgi:hypothetical protein